MFTNKTEQFITSSYKVGINFTLTLVFSLARLAKTHVVVKYLLVYADSCKII